MDEEAAQADQLGWLHAQLGCIFSSSFSPCLFASFFGLIDFDLRRRCEKRQLRLSGQDMFARLLVSIQTPGKEQKTIGRRGAANQIGEAKKIFIVCLTSYVLRCSFFKHLMFLFEPIAISLPPKGSLGSLRSRSAMPLVSPAQPS